ncbi:hypothetical protein [Gluconobacter frateurii]|uniref:Phage protein n=1 Tax=Gluconobacter frateurii NRIC 0228 TaxID=1307946 RepID=A0ABQ0QEA4_9PROT|nr:hypothetical protein [Gluconobacter frateurii]GBR15386.1 hypothetical protein AA0228_2499 [Gluconobacter frateurii NRIC 0228]GLP90295.1 hypothetical protein GCM10007868_13700 [Gluconobacter frateurii]
MPMVLDRPKGKLVTMDFNTAMGRIQSVTEVLLCCRDAMREMGASEISEKCSLAKGELEQLIDELTYFEE